MIATDIAYQQCVLPSCGATFNLGQALFACPKCGALLDVRYDWDRCDVPKSLRVFDERRGGSNTTRLGRLDASGVWRFRELLPFAQPDDLVTLGEGRTILANARHLAKEIGHEPDKLFLQYEGFNPSGSFKDNGMAAAFTMARKLGKRRVACASTGNTSASLAMFARHTTLADGATMEGIVFVGGDKIAFGKLAQALDYGARTIQVRGDFDACMSLVKQSTERLGLYLMNSVNPFRLEGQKTIMYRVLEGLGWEVPDWIVVPGGNLGNSSAFGKAFMELHALGLIERIPRIAIINATGANTLFELVNERGLSFNGGDIDHDKVTAYLKEMDEQGRRAHTVASAIEIGRPVNLDKALRTIEITNGIVRQATDEEILDGKALVGKHGYGCEPASGASVAGVRMLLDQGVIAPGELVVCILTGHALKDPNVTVDYHTGKKPDASYGNPPVPADADIESIAALLGE